MTSRGNPSISPPVQISQPRPVPTIPGTPPPNQQLFTGQPPPISQSHFDYTAQQQGQAPLLHYQAYGSAPNELRANSAPAGRGGMPQGNMASAGHYYPANQNMRHPQPPQNQGQFFVNPQPQRHQRQPAASNQTILMLPQTNNMVISSMYPSRLPIYPSTPSYTAYQNPPGQMMFFSNPSVSRGSQPMTMSAPNVVAPRQREKHILSITDPNTGRNITDDLLKNPNAPDGQQDDSSINDKGMEIRKDFTRQVAERMKTGDNLPPHQPPPDMSNQSLPPSQQQPKHTQPLYPPQQQQHAPNQPQASIPGVSAPSAMVRPPMAATQQPLPMMGGPPAHMMSPRPGMMPPRPMPSQTPPNSQPRMPINVNLSRPPPQLPNNYYDGRPQQPQGQQQQQPPPTVVGQIPPASVMPGGPPQPIIPQQPHPAPHQPAVPPVEASMPRTAAVTQPVVAVEASPPVAEPKLAEPPCDQQPKVVPPAPSSNIPSRPAASTPEVAPATLPEPQAPTQPQEPQATAKTKEQPAGPADRQEPKQPPATSQQQRPSPVEAPVVEAVAAKEAAVEAEVTPPPASVAPVYANTAASTRSVESTPSPEPSIAPQQSAPAPTPTTIPTPVEESKEGTISGAGTQGNGKDVRKGKRSKKDFNRKDLGGSEMDAFIDAPSEQCNGHIASAIETGGPAVTLACKDIQDQSQENLHNTPRVVSGMSATTLSVEVDMDDITSQERFPLNGGKDVTQNVEKCPQVDNKKSRKKKKKKGRKAAAQTQQTKESSKTSTHTEATHIVVNGNGAHVLCNGDVTVTDYGYGIMANSSEEEPKEASSTPSPLSTMNGNGQAVALVSLERRDSTEATPNVAQMEPQAEKKEVTNAVQEADSEKESSPAASIREPTSAPLPPASQVEALAREKQAAKPPPTPQKAPLSQDKVNSPKAVVVEKSAPSQKVVTSEKPAVQNTAVPEKFVPQQAAPVKEDAAPTQRVMTLEKSTPPRVIVTDNSDKEQVPNQKRQPELEKNVTKPSTDGDQQVGNGEPAETPNKAKPSAKENHQAFNDENEPPKEGNKWKADNKMADNKMADESAKDTDASKQKKDGKDKLQYDRAYLMELRECRSSQTKPDGLPDLDIILDVPVSAPRISGSAPLDFTPSFFQPTPGQRHAPPIGKSSSRGRPRPGEPTQRIIKSVSMSNDKPLHVTDKPWKSSKNDDSDENKKTLEGEVLFIMNRLTPTNFERLAEEMKKLNISTYDQLTEVVNIFFEKATMETKFVEAYAELCKIMSLLKVPPPPNMKDNQASFRVVMLTKCQQEFESDKTAIFEDPEEKKKKIEADYPEDNAERAEKIENALYQLKLQRMRFYGNIRFIGELYKLGLLTEKIMHDCILRLLRARDDDSLLSLCQLLTTVGKDLDIDKAKARMDQYFTQMSKIAEERKSRIKFTLMDVMDLRQNRWIPRKEAAGPKKIAEVHKDFAQEQARAQYLQSQPLPPRNDSSQQPGSRRGSRQRPDDKTDDGWNMVVATKGMRIDASKMKISKTIHADEIQLGPGGGMNKPLWARGSVGGAQQSQEDKSGAPGNRFSALRNDEDRRTFQRSPSRGDGGPSMRGIRQGPTAGHGRGKIISRSSAEGERREALASARSLLGGGRSQNSSRDNSWNRDDRRPYGGPRSSGERDMRPNEFRAPAAPPPAAATKKAPELSRDDMENKAKNILEEYLSIKDLAEAKLCVQELSSQPLMHVLVSSSMNDVLEKHDEARFSTGQYFHELLIAKLISPQMFLKGFVDVLEFAEDMIIDIPKLWTCLAQMVTPVLLGGNVSLQQVKTAVAEYLSNRSGAILMANIISLLAEKVGEDRVIREASGLEWETFLKPDEVKTFLQDRKVDFILKPPSSSSGPSSLAPAMGVEQLSSDLENLIRNRASNSELIAYIERLPDMADREKIVVRALMTAIAGSLRSKFSQPSSMGDEEVIKFRKDVLLKFMGTKLDLQLQALFAIQLLMTQLEHPSGVMDRFFSDLYNEDVIEEEAFYKWRESNEPQEQAGKGASLMQLNQFYTFLRQDDASEAS